MTAEVITRVEQPELTPFQVVERVITSGDLAQMKPQERVAFYWRTCESLGLNPLTRPFEFISLNSKLTMYARKDATDQLRKINAVSVTKLERERTDDMMMVTAYGRDRSGREDSAIGAVSIKGLAGEALANALMKAETKAKRRMTLSLVGLGFLDETEIDGADPVDVDPTTGEITAKVAPRTLLEAVHRQQEKLADAPAVIDGTATDLDELPPAAEALGATETGDPGPTPPTPAPAAPVAARPAAARQAPESRALTFEAFNEGIRSLDATPEELVEACRALFPDAKRISGLTGEQRDQLLGRVAELVEARQAAARS